MLNTSDYDRLSSFVGDLVNTRIKPIAQAITSSDGYLATLVTQGKFQADRSATFAGTAGDAATLADTAASSATLMYNEFSTVWLGIADSDPVRNRLGVLPSSSAFYVRRGDGRLRYVTSFDNAGNPVYADATVAADAESIRSAGLRTFLALVSSTNQNVDSPVAFLRNITVPRVTNWQSQQVTTATDVVDRIKQFSDDVALSFKATNDAVTALSSNAVVKTGSTMSKPLTIRGLNTDGSLIVSNTTANSGKTWQVTALNNGGFAISDTSRNDGPRFTLGTDGNAVVAQTLTVVRDTWTSNLNLNAAASTDSGLSIMTDNVVRWQMRRSPSSKQLYIARMDSTGVFQDTPLLVSETDGSVTVNRLTINGPTLGRGNMRIDSGDGQLLVNATSNVTAPGMGIMRNGVLRWYVGRDDAGRSFFINRHSDTGAYIGPALVIDEISGRTTVGLFTATSVDAVSSVSAPILYARANGTGKAIAVGDDVWLGDNNYSNGLSIRGQNDFNAGWIGFGNSNRLLGCNANDATLRYGADPIFHGGYMGSGSGLDADSVDGYHANAFERVVASNLVANGGYIIYSSGKKECWGFATTGPNTYTRITYPITFDSFSNAQFDGATADNNAQDNDPGVTTADTTGCTLFNARDNNVFGYWSAKGR